MCVFQIMRMTIMNAPQHPIVFNKINKSINIVGVAKQPNPINVDVESLLVEHERVSEAKIRMSIKKVLFDFYLSRER